jgi:hypothetical protein
MASGSLNINGNIAFAEIDDKDNDLMSLPALRALSGCMA